MLDFHRVGVFKAFTWQKVLPAIYDDNLSLYEVMGKLKVKMNELIHAHNKFMEDVEGGAITPNLQVGDVEVKPYGSDIEVEITGDKLNPIINFTLTPGPKGETGATGATGAAGRDGHGLLVTDTVTTTGGLPSTAPLGTCYAVGASAPYTIYIYTTQGWTNMGQLQGAQGPQGEQGPQGLQGEQGIQGEQGLQGVQGIQGETGAAGTDGANAVITTGTIQIPANAWNSTSKTAQITTSLITATNNAIVGSGVDDYSFDTWRNNNIRAIAQSAGAITFKCDIVPSAGSDPINVRLIVLEVES